MGTAGNWSAFVVGFLLSFPGGKVTSRRNFNKPSSPLSKRSGENQLYSGDRDVTLIEEKRRRETQPQRQWMARYGTRIALN
jgi:hypothetical protein